MTANNDTSAKLRAACLRLLARREHSGYELKQKLLGKGFDSLDIDKTLAEFAEQGWQNDQRFAESYARHRMNQGFGPVAISYELRQKGIESMDLDSLVAVEAGDWQTVLLQTYQKKYPEEATLSRTDWSKRYRFLLQRGFPAQMLNQLPKQLAIKIV